MILLAKVQPKLKGSGYFASRGKITPCYFAIWRQNSPSDYFAASAKIALSLMLTQTLTQTLTLILTLIPTLALTRGARKGGQGGASAPPWKLRCQVFFVFKFAK